MCPIAYTTDEKQELAKWLTDSFQWDYFLTVTFRWWARPEQSQPHFSYIRRALTSYAPQHLFLGAELHKKGDLHVHGLYQSAVLAEAPWPRAQELWHVLFKRFGRSKVEVIRSQGDVVNYCTKYVTKELTDYNIW